MDKSISDRVFKKINNYLVPILRKNGSLKCNHTENIRRNIKSVHTITTEVYMPSNQERTLFQRKYDQAGRSLSFNTYKSYCGHGSSRNEERVITRYTSPGDRILEVGSGAFIRTAAIYQKHRLLFYGCDPLTHIVQRGSYASRTVIANLSANALQSIKFQHVQFTFVGIFGSVFNGIISQQREHDFWQAISILAHEHNSTIAFDTLLAPYNSYNPQESFEEEDTGGLHRLGITQYYPSRTEIMQMLDANNLHIIEELDDRVPYINKHRKMFVIKARS